MPAALPAPAPDLGIATGHRDLLAALMLISRDSGAEVEFADGSSIELCGGPDDVEVIVCNQTEPSSIDIYPTVRELQEFAESLIMMLLDWPGSARIRQRSGPITSRARQVITDHFSGRERVTVQNNFDGSAIDWSTGDDEGRNFAFVGKAGNTVVLPLAVDEIERLARALVLFLLDLTEAHRQP